MTKNNFYISLGVWLILIPILGIPGVWRYRIIELTGLFLILHSAWPAILKRVSQKPRIKKEKKEVKSHYTEAAQDKKEENPEVKNDSEQISFNSNTVEVPTDIPVEHTTEPSQEA